MEHTKKMVLVEPRQIEKWKETMLDKTLSRLDGEIYDVLHRDVPDDEKAKLYTNNLSRYLNLDKPEPIKKTFSLLDALAAVDTPTTTTTTTAATVDASKPMETQVLATVPKKWQSQASRLLKHIENNTDVSWSDKGELVLNDVALPKTHAVDLINDLLRKRTTTSKPTGWKQFADVLKDANIPHELIGNEDRWNYISGKPTASHNTSSPNRVTIRRRQKKRYSWEPY
jgi:hypothetical protein